MKLDSLITQTLNTNQFTIINMTIQELKKELGLSNKDIAEIFGLKETTYANSSAKKRYEAALCSFYAFVKSKEGGQN